MGVKQVGEFEWVVTMPKSDLKAGELIDSNKPLDKQYKPTARAYPRIYSALYNRPHVILPDKARAISSIFERRATGETLSDAEMALIVDQRTGFRSYVVYPDGSEWANFAVDTDGTAVATGESKARPPVHRAGQLIAVIPLFGTLNQHGSSLNSSGVTSLSRFMKEVRRASSDPDIGTIVIQVNSPGGEVFGTEEASDELFSLRSSKKIIASVDSMMASGALWVATAAHEVTMTPGGTGGSHGVVTIHTDISAAEEAMGIKTTLIATPQKKVDGNPWEPLSEATVADIEKKNTQVYDKFTKALARNRDMTTKAVIENFGGGGMLMADEAKKAGMVDRIEPFRATIDRILSGIKSDNSRRTSQRARELELTQL